MIKKTYILWAGMLALAIGTPGIYAQDLAVEPYVGAGYGQYKFEFDDNDLFDDDFDDDQDGYRVFAGTHFTDGLAAEISWYEFDSADDKMLESDLEGASFALLFNAPIVDDRFSLFAKAGWFWWEADVETTVRGSPVLSEDYDGDDPFFGVGLKVGFTDALALRIEYDRFELDDDIDPELDFASASLQVSF